MKKLLLFLILFPFFVCSQNAINNLINPKGKWYFGFEMGVNTINSFSFGEANKSIQSGILAEHYTGRHWSLIGRIKYYETGVSFYKPNTHSGSWFDLGSDESFGTFNGAVISIPIDIKWEFRIFKNLAGNFKLGLAYNFETKSKYSNYSANLSTDYSKQYVSLNTGYGLNYFLNKKVALFIDLELYSGASKGKSDGLLWGKTYYTKNNLINFGIKFNFKK